MPPTIGDAIRQVREERGLSQYDVERLSNGKLKRGWLATLEKKQPVHLPQGEKLELLASILGTTIEDIYQRAGIIDIPPEGVSPDEKQMIEDYRALSQRDRARARRILRDLAEAESIEEQGQSSHDAEKKHKAA